MGFDHTVRQAFRIHRKTVVHRSDFNLTRRDFFHRMVGPVMAVVHFQCLATQSQCQHLVAQTNTKDRQIGVFQQRADHRHGIDAGGRRIVESKATAVILPLLLMLLGFATASVAALVIYLTWDVIIEALQVMVQRLA